MGYIRDMRGAVATRRRNSVLATTYVSTNKMDDDGPINQPFYSGIKR